MSLCVLAPFAGLANKGGYVGTLNANVHKIMIIQGLKRADRDTAIPQPQHGTYNSVRH